MNRFGLKANKRIGLNHYVGCHHDSEAPIDVDNNGLLFLNSEVRYSDILDGSAHTILLGECKQNSQSLGWVVGDRSTLRNTSGFDQRDYWSMNDEEEEDATVVGKFGVITREVLCLPLRMARLVFSLTILIPLCLGSLVTVLMAN